MFDFRGIEMRYRDFAKMSTKNDGTRSLFESIIIPEVIKTLSDWCKADGPGVLIGGVALSYYVKPRMTQDADFLFISDDAIPNSVRGFKKIRPHSFQHNKTHVEVELVTPQLVNVPVAIVEVAISSAMISDGVKVASPSSLVALKLYRLSMQDKADIIALIKTGKVNLDDFPLHSEQVDAFEQLIGDAALDAHPS